MDDVLLAAHLAIFRSLEKPAQRERHVELNLASQNQILNGYVRYADSKLTKCQLALGEMY